MKLRCVFVGRFLRYPRAVNGARSAASLSPSSSHSDVWLHEPVEEKANKRLCPYLHGTSLRGVRLEVVTFALDLVARGGKLKLLTAIAEVPVMKHQNYMCFMKSVQLFHEECTIVTFKFSCDIVAGTHENQEKLPLHEKLCDRLMTSMSHPDSLIPMRGFAVLWEAPGESNNSAKPYESWKDGTLSSLFWAFAARVSLTFIASKNHLL